MNFIEVAPKKNRGGSREQNHDVEISKASEANKHVGYYFAVSKLAYENKIGYRHDERVYLRVLKTSTYPDRLYLSFSEDQKTGRRLYAPQRQNSQKRRCVFKGFDLASFEGNYQLTWDANERMFYIDKSKKED